MENKSKTIRKNGFLNRKSPAYLTSHSQPQNLRKYIANKERLDRMDCKSFNAWGKPKAIPKKDLTWAQAKVRFPKLNPYKDRDKDGVINLLDCKPFNKKKQDEEVVDFEYIKSLKTIGDVQRLEEDIIRRGKR